MADDKVLRIDGKPINELRVVDLKKELDKRNLSKSGSKKELIERLRQHLHIEKLREKSLQDGEQAPSLQIKDAGQNEFVKQYMQQRQKLFEIQMTEKKKIEEEQEQKRKQRESESQSESTEAEAESDVPDEASSSKEDSTTEKPSKAAATAATLSPALAPKSPVIEESPKPAEASEGRPSRRKLTRAGLQSRRRGAGSESPHQAAASSAAAEPDDHKDSVQEEDEMRLRRKVSPRKASRESIEIAPQETIADRRKSKDEAVTKHSNSEPDKTVLEPQKKTEILPEKSVKISSAQKHSPVSSPEPVKVTTTEKVKAPQTEKTTVVSSGSPKMLSAERPKIASPEKKKIASPERMKIASPERMKLQFPHQKENVEEVKNKVEKPDIEKKEQTKDKAEIIEKEDVKKTVEKMDTEEKIKLDEKKDDAPPEDGMDTEDTPSRSSSRSSSRDTRQQKRAEPVLQKEGPPLKKIRRSHSGSSSEESSRSRSRSRSSSNSSRSSKASSRSRSPKSRKRSISRSKSRSRSRSKSPLLSRSKSRSHSRSKSRSRSRSKSRSRSRSASAKSRSSSSESGRSRSSSSSSSPEPMESPARASPTKETDDSPISRSIQRPTKRISGPGKDDSYVTAPEDMDTSQESPVKLSNEKEKEKPQVKESHDTEETDMADTANKDAEDKHKVPLPKVRKRKWGITKTTAPKRSISISTESLKGLIDIKPGTMVTEPVLELVPEGRLSEHEEEDKEKEEEPIKITRTVVMKEEELEPEAMSQSEEKQVVSQNGDGDGSDGEAASSPPRADSRHVEAAQDIRVARKQSPKPDDASGQKILRRVVSREAPKVVADEPEAARRSPSPAKNPLTKSVHVRNLVRPFTVGQLKQVLSATGTLASDGFWMDKIKSHCIATYETEEQANETRKALHGTRWPSSNPKHLRVEFSSIEEVEFHQKGEAGPFVQKKAAAAEAKPDPEAKQRVSERDAEHERRVAEYEKREKAREERRKERQQEAEKREKERDKTREEREKRRKQHVREWDRDKIRQSESRSRSRSPKPEDRKRRSGETRREQDRSGDADKGRDRHDRKEKKAEEEPPAKLLDDLFRKTKSIPCIYWLPLTEEQIRERDDARTRREKERATRAAQQQKEKEEVIRRERMRIIDDRRRERDREPQKDTERSRSTSGRRR